ncbi:M16 family metallopeptidase [Roseivirga thermotolerans]|uniref:M16 family metallopeptidase n=1 Tax=Roseivirga thermotolerans TaxID=1758176 RepID=UPI00273E5AF0|nr:pitrilysin family protein [Roseivirga thermotolerans]
MLDRTQAPSVQQVQKISLPPIEKFSLPGGGNLYAYPEKNTEAFRIELLTKGSNLNAQNAAEVQLAIKMLLEGTNRYSGAQLSEKIDELGSFVEITPGFDHSSISIYGLKKHFNENIGLLSDIIYESSFHDQALNTLKEKEQNRLKLNMQKGSYTSSINLRNALFKDHPYGYRLYTSDINSINSQQLQTFHKNYTCSFDIFLSGDLPSNYYQIVSGYFSKRQPEVPKQFEAPSFKESNAPKDTSHRDSKFVQSSIKLGKRLFTRSSPDYFRFMVANELLGGFFGSRLMKNIREDKGYTYGIYSSLYPLNHSGYFVISTDVKAEYEQETIREIYKEIKRLQEEPVSAQELKVVKNYMIGNYLNAISSPFSIITKYKTLVTQSLPTDFYNNYLEAINNTSREDIQDVLSTHLQTESLTRSISGFI